MLDTFYSPAESIADRLRHSRNLRERRSICAGRTCHHGIPVLLDTDQLLEHMHIVGPTGRGKTSLAQVPQLVWKMCFLGPFSVLIASSSVKVGKLAMCRGKL